MLARLNGWCGTEETMDDPNVRPEMCLGTGLQYNLFYDQQVVQHNKSTQNMLGV